MSLSRLCILFIIADYSCRTYLTCKSADVPQLNTTDIIRDSHHAAAAVSHPLDAVEWVPVSPLCSMHTDVKRITHSSNKRLVTIDLLSARRCLNPTFLLRLSGAALYQLSLDKQRYEKKFLRNGMDFFSPNRNTLIYSYPPIRDAGMYFLEILVLFCGEFDPNDFSNSCIENMEEGKSILNSPYSVWLNQSTIDETLQLDVEAVARWKFAPHSDFNTTPALLPTRFQRKNCDHQFCEEQQQELWQHEFYAWVDAPGWRQLLVPSRPPITLCFVGSSHSRLLAQYAQRIDKSKVVKYQFIEAKYLKDVNIDRLYGTDNKHSEACTHVVIGASQWSVSWAQHSSPYTVDRFKREIHELLKLFAQHKAFDPKRLYLRTTNYNSLGNVYS